MSVLKRGDESMHYSDGSHKWTPPDNDDNGQWRTKVEAHLQAHREAPNDGYAPGRTPRVPGAHRQ